MNARNITDAAFLDALSNLGRKPEPSLNIARVVRDFDGDFAKLTDICQRIVNAARGSRGEFVKQSEFDALKAFVQYADGDFALIGICRPETGQDMDQQTGREGSRLSQYEDDLRR